MAEQSSGLIKTVRIIDKFTDTTGIWVAWLNMPLVLAVAYEVMSRYFFDDPTIWSYDLSYMLYGTLFMLGAAFALRRGAHIRTDMLWEKFSITTKGMIDFYAYIVFFFPGMILFFMLVGRDEGLARLQHRRDFRADAVAADPVAVQDGGAARLPAAADPGRVRADQELVHDAHRQGVRAQGEDRDMTGLEILSAWSC